jgi:hypothetical protein
MKTEEQQKIVLELPVDFKYYDMIVYEGKREEYRDIKPYWEKRLARPYTHVRFRRGYTKTTAEFRLIGIRTGEGRPKWGGIPGKKVFVIAFEGQPLPSEDREHATRPTLQADQPQ